jgi:hypothetical protein
MKSKLNALLKFIISISLLGTGAYIHFAKPEIWKRNKPQDCIERIPTNMCIEGKRLYIYKINGKQYIGSGDLVIFAPLNE